MTQSFIQVFTRKPSTLNYKKAAFTKEEAEKIAIFFYEMFPDEFPVSEEWYKITEIKK